MTPLGNELITHLLELPLNKKKKLKVTQIKHGINSRVFRVKHGTKNIAVIKVYPSESATERLKAELSFLKFVF